MTTPDNTPDPAQNCPDDSRSAQRCNRRNCTPRGKLHCFNWLDDIPGGAADSDLVEVQFKNTRKGFFRNSLHLPLAIGDIVAVEAAPGHDIGEVTLTGRLVDLQIRKAGVKQDTEMRRVLRKAKPADLSRFEEAKAKENDTMIRARKIAEDCQGDGNKAIFYYIADERVDFRHLIKVLAEAFKVRIEMKQIGARQEAGRIGGIGPCGRPLCCASWMTNFVSVGTAAARFQDISLNPQKLAGQCAKLKCCLNFEVDSYVEALKRMPPKEARLETADSTYYTFKYDVFKREITYSTDKSVAANLVTISADRAFEVIALNKDGEKPLSLLPDGEEKTDSGKQYNDILGQDNINRFDSKKKKKRKPKSKAKPQPDNGPQPEEKKESVAETPQKNDKPERSEKPRQQRKPQRGERRQRPSSPDSSEKKTE